MESNIIIIILNMQNFLASQATGQDGGFRMGLYRINKRSKSGTWVDGTPWNRQAAWVYRSKYQNTK